MELLASMPAIPSGIILLLILIIVPLAIGVQRGRVSLEHAAVWVGCLCFCIIAWGVVAFAFTLITRGF